MTGCWICDAGFAGHGADSLHYDRDGNEIDADEGREQDHATERYTGTGRRKAVR